MYREYNGLPAVYGNDRLLDLVYEMIAKETGEELDRPKIVEEWKVKEIHDLTGNSGLHYDIRLRDFGPYDNADANFTGYASNGTEWMLGMSIDNRNLTYGYSVNETGIAFIFNDMRRHRSYPENTGGFNCTWNQTKCAGSVSVGRYWNIRYDFTLMQTVDFNMTSNGSPVEMPSPRGFITVQNRDSYSVRQVTFKQIFDFLEPNFTLQALDLTDNSLIYQKDFKPLFEGQTEQLSFNDTQNYTNPTNTSSFIVKDNITDFLEGEAWMQRNHSIIISDLDPYFGYERQIGSHNLTFILNDDGFTALVGSDGPGGFFRCKPNKNFTDASCSGPVSFGGWIYSLDISAQDNWTVTLNMTKAYPAWMNKDPEMIQSVRFGLFDHLVTRTDNFGRNGTYVRSIDVKTGRVGNFTELDVNRNFKVVDFTEGALESTFVNVTISGMNYNATIALAANNNIYRNRNYLMLDSYLNGKKNQYVIRTTESQPDSTLF